MNDDEIERLATTLTTFMADQNPAWLASIRDQQARGFTYEMWRESYTKFTADFLPGMKAVAERMASNGIDPDKFMRAMWDVSRKLAKERRGDYAEQPGGRA